MVAPASLNVTVPVGVPVPGATALTVAVKVRLWPETDGLAEEASAVALLAKVAWPLLRAFVASGVPPSWKTTLPLGVPEPGNTALTVAVNVTDWPNTDGLFPDASVVAVLA